ncbi:glycosyltransferase 61 family protein [Paracoccus laeviglucosivorans]|nr:glycosyltransferase 61 family protein [Paracoccus laeviglucosivorans]
MPDGTRIETAISYTHGRSRHADIAFPTDAEMDDLPGTHIFGGIFFGHFGHFITESTGRLWALDEPGVDTRSVVYIPKAGPVADGAIRTQVSLLAAIGIDVSMNVVKGPTRVERLLIPRQEFGLDENIIAGSPRYIAFSRAAAARTKAEGPERLYISRRDLPLDRGTILGELFLEKLLAAEGYDIWLPHRASKEEQVAHYRAAKEIVSVDASPLHLLAYVARPDQKLAIIKRRSMDAVDFIHTHVTSFGGSQVTIIDALRADHVHERMRRIGRSSWGEVDFAEIGARLHEFGLISDPAPWRHWPESEMQAQLQSIEATAGAKFLRIPAGQSQPMAEEMD